MAGGGSFLVALLRRGAPAIATATSELPDEIADPAPMHALRRISRMSGPIDPTERDSLLLRATRYVVLIPLAYRLLAVPGQLGVYVLQHGTTGLLPVGVFALLSVALNFIGLRWMFRSAPFRGRDAGKLLAVDLAFTVLSPLVIALTVPTQAYFDALAVTSVHVYGEIGLLTLALGLPSGLVFGLLGFPLRMLANWLNTGRFQVGAAFSTYSVLLAELFLATAALVLTGLGTRLALAYGTRNGRLAERAQQHRRLHDTVLQTLEAMALSGPGDAEERLVEIQRLARAQAMEIRHTIESAASERAEAGARPLGEKLAALAAEMARDGLRAQLVVAELDDDTLSEVRQIAIRDAVREAMRNTMKHSGTDRVVVRVEERDGGIAVITRDHGSGFSAADHPAGFGISESITARLAEVGGTSLVESGLAGGGTRVTLWVPF
ncbi:two-component system histidine kinase [Amycolatopsis mediterranei S699]|uniref:Two-component system histidine kinase n=2 Tax=Amycolatopsis mediterranei TaxID=33910 RepID=A0A0H3DLE8_AMYMU|nr:ATP-binding protein [Amycolatopsis mediterranei]ADJ51033.1 two-component system histidine kinase [Amycolatopsis mediterranei U32]AEK48048.1 two-component system histidine kinase [Amycolatopsis mediterranei S699]AFO82738.1 two-component system histidine kinase [Amycolatopsis mediterranei S699]AGT89868.1 two-component system histidine kinase [Amycolatopsis mediterranei RB]KDO11973.1 histidine kinase [Amycolatopsis mediterranei]